MIHATLKKFSNTLSYTETLDMGSWNKYMQCLRWGLVPIGLFSTPYPLQWPQTALTRVSSILRQILKLTSRDGYAAAVKTDSPLSIHRSTKHYLSIASAHCNQEDRLVSNFPWSRSQWECAVSEWPGLSLTQRPSLVQCEQGLGFDLHQK